ncbi:hypothetical protein SHIRM173S_10043 [Streptomyces hirsutus]
MPDNRPQPPPPSSPVPSPGSSDPAPLLLCGARLTDGRTVDVRLGGGRIEAVGTAGSLTVVVSSMGADPAHEGDEVFDVYQRAKGEADAYVRGLDALEWTILRPGMLTDDAGTGLVRLEAHTGRGSVPRDDVAAVLAELVEGSSTAGLTLELISGPVPVPVAVKAVAGE